MSPLDILRKKRDGSLLSTAEISAFVEGATRRAWPDYQVSALLMAIFLRGMTPEETSALTRAMAHSGSVMDLSDVPGPKVDKHSTGGVGDKTSLILAPLAAACGVIVPMMSGRGLGHSGGTLDKLESIPGFRVDLDAAEFRATLRDVGCALIGQTAAVAPADKTLYALRDVTATVESIPLITASILSKKLAAGIDGLVLDVKCGQGAFMKTPDDARALARSLATTGNQSGLRTVALLTDMHVPLGCAVGNALEVKECLAVLRGQGPADVTDLSVALAARMLVLGGLAATTEAAEEKVHAALRSGQGLEKFRQIVARQGGDPNVIDRPELLPQAKEKVLLRAERAGYVSDIHAEKVGRACVLLGAGRQRVEDAVDHAVGVLIKAHRGAQVSPRDVLAEVHVNDRRNFGTAHELLKEAWVIGAAPPKTPLLIEETKMPLAV